MSEEKVPRQAVEETQQETATTDQPGSGPPQGDGTSGEHGDDAGRDRQSDG